MIDFLYRTLKLLRLQMSPNQTELSVLVAARTHILLDLLVLLHINTTFSLCRRSNLHCYRWLNLNAKDETTIRIKIKAKKSLYFELQIVDAMFPCWYCVP